MMPSTPCAAAFLGVTQIDDVMKHDSTVAMHGGSPPRLAAAGS